ncbi:GntR family transcriptional regulator [Labrenzia aggregata]|uniref:GntR family transcriptional regulator n=2 Tax=Roseibium aggregatum TaxID=187304 RepID=A0A926S6N8_9HYPH|nr:GntR family transcriptional regulator [Roseibium aggregatum]
MKILPAQPSLTEQVYKVIVDEICSGALPEGAHLVQEQVAARLGVSRQPVQQAMTLLKADGLVEEIGRRGLYVTALDLDLMRQHYEIRAVLDGLAARMAAEQVRSSPEAARAIEARGKSILESGKAAVANNDVAAQIDHDEALHALVYDFSGNALVARTAEPHWRFLRRAMGEVLRHAKLPREIWRQHAEILEAIVQGDPDRAEQLAVDHDLEASKTLYDALAEQQAKTA